MDAREAEIVNTIRWLSHSENAADAAHAVIEIHKRAVALLTDLDATRLPAPPPADLPPEVVAEITAAAMSLGKGGMAAYNIVRKHVLPHVSPKTRVKIVALFDEHPDGHARAAAVLLVDAYDDATAARRMTLRHGEDAILLDARERAERIRGVCQRATETRDAIIDALTPSMSASVALGDVPTFASVTPMRRSTDSARRDAPGCVGPFGPYNLGPCPSGVAPGAPVRTRTMAGMPAVLSACAHHREGVAAKVREWGYFVLEGDPDAATRACHCCGALRKDLDAGGKHDHECMYEPRDPRPAKDPAAQKARLEAVYPKLAELHSRVKADVQAMSDTLCGRCGHYRYVHHRGAYPLTGCEVTGCEDTVDSHDLKSGLCPCTAFVEPDPRHVTRETPRDIAEDDAHSMNASLPAGCLHGWPRCEACLENDRRTTEFGKGDDGKGNATIRYYDPRTKTARPIIVGPIILPEGTPWPPTRAEIDASRGEPPPVSKKEFLDTLLKEPAVVAGYAEFEPGRPVTLVTTVPRDKTSDYPLELPLPTGTLKVETIQDGEVVASETLPNVVLNITNPETVPVPRTLRYTVDTGAKVEHVFRSVGIELGAEIGRCSCGWPPVKAVETKDAWFMHRDWPS